MSDIMMLPMLAAVKPAPISPQRLKQLLAVLSGQHDRLATYLSFFKQQAGAMLQAAVNLHECGNEQLACKQLLRREPQLLLQQVALTTAALRQLVVQLDKEIEASRTTGMLVHTLGVMLLAVRARPYDSQTPCPADTAHLTMLQVGSW